MPSLKNIKFSYSSPPPPCIDPPPPPPPPPASPHPPCSPCQHKNHVPPPPPAVAPPPSTYFPPPPPTIQPGTIAPPPPSPPTIQPGTIAPPPPSTYFPPPPPTIQPSTIAPPPRVVQPSTNAPPPRSAPNYPPPIFAPSNPPMLSSPPWGYSAPSIAPLPPPQSSNHIPLMVGTSLGGLFFLSFLVIGINYFYAKLAVPKSGGQELGPRPSRGDGGVRTTAAVPHGDGGRTASQLKVDNSMDAAGPSAEDIVDQGTLVPPLEKGKQLAPPSSEHKPGGDSGDPTPGKEPPPEDSQSSEKEKEREREREKKAKTDEVIKSLKETKTLLTGLLQMKKLEHNELKAAHDSITNKKLDPVPDPSPETLDRFQQDKAEIMPTTSSASKNTDVENKTSINDSAEKQEIVGDGDDDYDVDDEDDAPLEDQVPEKNDVNDDKAGEVGLQKNKEESEGTRSEEKTAPISKKKKKLSRKKQPDSNRPLATMVAKTALKELNEIGGESEKEDNADEDVDVGDDIAGGDEYKVGGDDDLVENKDDGEVTRSVEEKITPLNENGDGSERVEAKKHGINRRDKAKRSPMRPAMKSVAFVEKVAMEDSADGKSQSKTADVENDLNKTSAESTEVQEIVGGDDDDDDGVGDDVAGGDEYKVGGDDDLVENKDDGEVTRSVEEKITPLNENEDGSERVEAKKHGINRRDKAKRSPMVPPMKSVAFVEKVAMEDSADGKSQSKTADVENDLNKTNAESTEEQEIVGGDDDDDDDDDAPLGDQKENDVVDDEAGEEEKISPTDHDERDSPVAKNNKFPRKRQQSGSNRSSTKKVTSTQKQIAKTAQNELNKSSGESEKKDNADDDDDDDDDDDAADDVDDDDREMLADSDVIEFVEGMGLSSFKKWISIRKLVKANSRVVQELQKMDEKLRAERKKRGVGIDEAAKARSIGSEFMEEKIADNNDVEGETEKEHEAGEKTGENYEPPLMKRKRHVTQNMKSQKRESKTQFSQAEVKRHAVLGQGMVNEGEVMEEPDAEGDESYSGVDEEEEEGMQSADAVNTEHQQEPGQDERDQIMRYPAEENDEDAVARKIKAGKHKSNPPAKTQSYSAQVESLGEADESFLQELSVAGLDMKKGMQSAEMKRNDVTKRATSKNMKAGKSDHLNLQLQHAEAERSITHLVKKSGKLYEQEMANNDDDEEKYQQDLEQEIMSLGKGSVARNINRSTKPPLKQPKGKKPTTTATLNTIAQKKGISQLTNLPKLDEDNQDEEIDQPDDGDAVKQEYMADDDDDAAAEEGQSASTDAAAAEEGQSASTI